MNSSNFFKKLSQYSVIVVAAILVFFFILYLASIFDPGPPRDCGCEIPSVKIPSNAQSWDDTYSNWEYIECACVDYDEVPMELTLYLFYNDKLDKYRCQTKVSYPGDYCNENKSIYTITPQEYKSGEWKTLNFWKNGIYHLE